MAFAVQVAKVVICFGCIFLESMDVGCVRVFFIFASVYQQQVASLSCALCFKVFPRFDLLELFSFDFLLRLGSLNKDIQVFFEIIIVKLASIMGHLQIHTLLSLLLLGSFWLGIIRLVHHHHQQRRQLLEFKLLHDIGCGILHPEEIQSLFESIIVGEHPIGQGNILLVEENSH
jgi:hypothetical protein